MESQVDWWKPLFDRCFSKLNQFWTEDLEIWLREQPELYQQHQAAHNQIHGFISDNDSAGYRKALIEFYNLSEQIYRQYKELIL